MFDFHSFPLRIEEVKDEPFKGILIVGHRDSLYQRSKGGITPSGWKCDSLPYIVELDNFERTDREGKVSEDCHIWGYDEICWFAHQDEAYRNEWLWYAWNWIRKNDKAGWLQMPGARLLSSPINGLKYYFANTRSKKVPNGFNQEETIKDIWSKK